MKNNFVGLIILDGYGLNENEYGNAIKQAQPKNIDYYFKNYPFTRLNASGEYVGLPKGQAGNSEVGHLNIGAGKIVYQVLQEINNAIKDKTFFENKVLNNTIDHIKKFNGNLHIMGLVSDGGVHSHINHLYALLDFAVKNEVKNIFLHVFTDGRDTYRQSASNIVNELEQYISNYKSIKIASIMGRFYAMDREKDYNRIQQAYSAIVNGVAKNFSTDAVLAIKQSYMAKVYDEFINPIVIIEGTKPVATINDNDAIIFFNFREDRARQLTRALIEEDFNEFARKPLKNIYMTTFTSYDDSFKNTHVMFKKDGIKTNLSSVISKYKMKQFKITETTKYAHVTYFLNGGIEKSNEGEDRFLIETIKTDDFAKHPAMRAKEITDKAIQEINSEKYSLMVLNYSNCDMIGHTGNLSSAIETVKVVNEQVKRLVDTILATDGVAILTADHGNAEEMLAKDGHVLTDHTTNLVPFCVVGKNVQGLQLAPSGCLGNIAPTILDLLGVEKPQEFLCDSLVLK